MQNPAWSLFPRSGLVLDLRRQKSIRDHTAVCLTCSSVCLWRGTVNLLPVCARFIHQKTNKLSISDSVWPFQLSRALVAFNPFMKCCRGERIAEGSWCVTKCGAARDWRSELCVGTNVNDGTRIREKILWLRNVKIITLTTSFAR